MKTIRQIAEASGVPAKLLRGRLKGILRAKRAGGAYRYTSPHGQTYWLLPAPVARLLVAEQNPSGRGRKRGGAA